MSAIAGIYHTNGEPVTSEHSNGIMRSLQKYPADDVQIWQDGGVFLGCHAQWITPESVGERLPFYDPASRLAITADAIIDNREELFEKLQIDHSYRKQITDSDLILRAYQKWGEASPEYLVGDFAFMIWHERERRLFGARDFSGSRTLYYIHHGHRFAFCTTIMPLFTLPHMKKQLNEQWLAEYLAVFGMIDTVDASITPYKNIEQLPPAHSLSITEDQIRMERYRTVTAGEKLRLKSDEDYVEAFREIFGKAVTSRLRTHRHVGSQLSGGLDSGAVVGFAAKAMKRENETLHTFSYVPPSDFEDFTPKQLIPDERPFIQSAVNYVGGIKDHYLDFEGKNSYSEIEDFLDVMEMPYKFFENSFWLKGMFEKAHEEGVAVLLNGDRGNFTISWGSALDYYAILLKKLRWLQLIQELNQYCRNAGGARLRRLPDVARVAFPVIDQIFPQGTSYKLPRVIHPEFAKRTGVYERFKELGLDETGWYPATNIFKARKKHFQDVFHWNAGNTLSCKLSLRYRLWKRDPTNDLRVVRFCLSVPENQYVQNGMDRALIRRATKDLLPDDVRLNQQIRGVQGVDWVHRMTPVWDRFIHELQQLITDKRALEFLDGEMIKNSLFKVKDGPRPQNATDPHHKVLMRSLIIYRFIKNFI